MPISTVIRAIGAKSWLFDIMSMPLLQAHRWRIKARVSNLTRCRTRSRLRTWSVRPGPLVDEIVHDTGMPQWTRQLCLFLQARSGAPAHRWADGDFEAER